MKVFHSCDYMKLQKFFKESVQELKHPYSYKMYFRKLGLVYLEYPKAASTTLKYSLLESEYDIPQEHLKPGDRFWRKFLPSTHLKNEDEIKSNSFIFSLVRNPWWKTVSAFTDGKWNAHILACGGKLPNARPSFDEFLDVLTDPKHKFSIKVVRKAKHYNWTRYSGDPHFFPWSTFFGDFKKPHKVYKFEEMNEFQNDLSSISKLPIKFSEPKNVQAQLTGLKLRDFYSRQSAAQIERLFQCDIDRFGYSYNEHAFRS